MSSTADPDPRGRVRRRSRRPQGVLDQAAAKIANDAEHPVSRADARARPRSRACSRCSTTAGRPTTRPRTTPRSAAPSRVATPASGLWLRQGIDGEVTVASVQPDSPAADAGVKAGDVLLLVGSPAGDRQRRRRGCSGRCAGQGGTTVAITLRTRRREPARRSTLTRTEPSSGDVGHRRAALRRRPADPGRRLHRRGRPRGPRGACGRAGRGTRPG